MAPLRKECRIYLDVSFVISCRRSDIHVSSSFKLEKVSWYILALGLGLLVLDLDKEVLNLGRKVVKCWVISVFDTHKLLRKALTIYVVHCNSSCFLHVRVRMYGRSESEQLSLQREHRRVKHVHYHVRFYLGFTNRPASSTHLGCNLCYLWCCADMCGPLPDVPVSKQRHLLGGQVFFCQAANLALCTPHLSHQWYQSLKTSTRQPQLLEHPRATRFRPSFFSEFPATQS